MKKNINENAGIGNKTEAAIAAVAISHQYANAEATPIRLLNHDQVGCPKIGCQGIVVWYRFFNTVNEAGEAIARNEQGGCPECGQKVWKKQWFQAPELSLAEVGGDVATDLSAE